MDALGNQLAAIVEDICDAYKQILSELAQLQELLVEEYTAVQTHDIDRLEQTCQAKKRTGNAIEASVSEVNDAAKRLARFEESITGQVSLQAHDVTSVTASVARTIECLESKGIPSHQLQRASQLAISSEALLDAYCQAKIEIEKNRYILQELLRNHQASYVFWKEVVLEGSTSYDRSGARKAVPTISQLHVKV